MYVLLTLKLLTKSAFAVFAKSTLNFVAYLSRITKRERLLNAEARVRSQGSAHTLSYPIVTIRIKFWKTIRLLSLHYLTML
jgi:hypothetical protein